jgi:hypothetical protein
VPHERQCSFIYGILKKVVNVEYVLLEGKKGKERRGRKGRMDGRYQNTIR